MGRPLVLPNEAATVALGARLAAQLQAPVSILLDGDLGAGKTTLARAMIRTLTGTMDMEVPSPTFTLLQSYETASGILYHYDLYRLKTPDEIYELDWEAALATGIVLVEWPERLGTLRPRGAKLIELKVTGDERTAALTGFANV